MAGQDQPEEEAEGNNQEDSRRKIREKRMNRRTSKDGEAPARRQTIDRKVSKSFGPTSRTSSENMSNRRKALQAAGSRRGGEGSRRGPRTKSEEEEVETPASMRRLEGAQAAYTRTAARGVTRTKSLSRSKSSVDDASLSVANKLMALQSASSTKQPASTKKVMKVDDDLNKSWVLDPMHADGDLPDKKFDAHMSLKW